MKYLLLASLLVLPGWLFAQESEQVAPESAQSTEEEQGIDYAEYYEALKKQYDKLVDESSKKTSDAYDWVQKDFKNMFSWEYEVITVPVKEEEKLQKTLAKLGVERWELVQVVRVGDDYKLFLKRHPKSYLKSLPLKELLKFVPLGGGAGE